MKGTVISIRYPAALLAMLEAKAAAMGMTRNEYVKWLAVQAVITSPPRGGKHEAKV